MQAQIRIVALAVALALFTVLIPVAAAVKLALLTVIAVGLVLGVLREGP
jgi:hypothetical protein